MTGAIEEFICTVDVRQLRSGSLWPIMRVLASHFFEEIELGRYMRRLLATQSWSNVRVVPHADAGGLPSKHIVDVYGIDSGANAQRLQRSAAQGGG